MSAILPAPFLSRLIVSLDPIDIVIFAAYFASILALGGYLARRIRTGGDFFLGGRSFPFWAIGLSIVGTDIGAIDFVGLVGEGFHFGLVVANMDWIGSMPALLLAGLVFIPYYWRAGVYTVPEYMGRRYNQSVRGVLTFAWTIFLVLDMGIMFHACANWLEELMGWPYEYSIWGMAILTGAYTISGGLSAVVYTDVVQTIVMLGGGIAVVLMGLDRAGGIAHVQEVLAAQGNAQHLSLYHPAGSGTDYAWPKVFFGLVCILSPAYFIGNQAIVQRCLGAKDEWSARAGALFGAFFKFLVPFVVVVPGLIGRVLYPDLKVEDADKLFAILVKDLLGPGVRGFVLAGFFAGFMSTADSVLNSAATLITKDIVQGVFKAPIGEKGVLRWGRWTTFAILLFGALSAPICNEFRGVYPAIQICLSVIQGPTFALLLWGMFWRGCTAMGGISGAIAGLSSSLALVITHKILWNLNDSLPEVQRSWISAGEEPFFEIAIAGFLVSSLVMIVISLNTRRKTPEELEGLVFTRKLGGLASKK